MLAGLVLLSFAIPSFSLAQQADTVRVQPAAVSPSTNSSGNYTRENIYRLGKGIYTDTLRRDDFKAQAADVAELDDCDTTFQTFVLVRRLSPWRIGLFAGPNFAYCGTWENTFGPNKRDNSLYNGAGFNITANVDYFLTPATRRLRFGMSALPSVIRTILPVASILITCIVWLHRAAFNSSQVTINQASFGGHVPDRLGQL